MVFPWGEGGKLYYYGEARLGGGGGGHRLEKLPLCPGPSRPWIDPCQG